jgi:hypothetical protein
MMRETYTVDFIEKLAFNQIKALSLATIRREIL